MSRLYFSDKYDTGTRRRWPLWAKIALTVVAAIGTWALMFFGALWVVS